jgi:predicted DNA-binding transcriptional regulator YafY
VLETSARLLRLLSLFQSQRDWTGAQLADRLGVSPRTVRHDVDRLRQLGYQVDATLGAAGGYRLAAGEVIPPLLLDDDEAVAVAVGLGTAAAGSIAGIEEASIRALEKLQPILPVALRQRVRALQAFTGPASPPSVDAAVLTELSSACSERETIRFDYRRHDGTESHREVEPYRLVSTGRQWYLVAWDTGSEEWRTFRADRISLPTNHGGRRFVPRPLPDDDPASYVLRGIWQAAWPYQVTVVAHAEAGAIAARLPGHHSVEVIDDQTCRVQLGADGPSTLAAWLGILDCDFDVVTPEAHPELLGQLQRLAERYSHAGTALGTRDSSTAGE